MLETPKALTPDNGTALEIICRGKMAVMDNQQVSARDIGWLTALYEGEGSFGLYWSSGQKKRGFNGYIAVMTTLTNTDTSYLERAVSILHSLGIGANCQFHKHPPSAKSHWKPRNDVIVQGVKRCAKLCAAILPHMTPDNVKTKKVEIMKEFCDLRVAHQQPFHTPYTEHERALYMRFKSLCDRPAGKRRSTTSETRCLPSFSKHERKRGMKLESNQFLFIQ